MITGLVVGFFLGTVCCLIIIPLYDIRQTQKRIKWMREQNDLLDLIIENNATSKAYKDWSEESAQAWYKRAERFLAETEHLVEQDKEIT